MKGYIGKIISWYNSLTGVQKLIVTSILVIILMLLVYIISNVRIGYDLIDYKNITRESLLQNSVESNDRDIFTKGEGIINSIINSYFSKYYIEDEEDKVSDFYNYTLINDYKYAISSGRFNNNVKEICNDFEEEQNTDDISSLVGFSIVDTVYLYSEDNEMYLFKLNISSDEHYIGIKFDENNKYSIFYLE